MRNDFLKERGEEFLKTFEFHFKEGMYNLSAFDLEQALQMFLKFTLKNILRYYPPIHSVKELVEILKKSIKDPEIKESIERIERENISILGMMEQAYISSRYLPYTYSREEVEKMRDFLYAILEVLKRIWKNP